MIQLSGLRGKAVALTSRHGNDQRAIDRAIDRGGPQRGEAQARR